MSDVASKRTAPSLQEYLERHHEVPGWFTDEDVAVFRRLLDWQGMSRVHGDLLEIGVYHGRSAILLGYFVEEGEHLVVCDTFGGGGTDASNDTENELNYPGLSVVEFQQQYAAWHAQPPVVHAVPSTSLAPLVSTASCRFVHVDGSHLYDVVRADADLARSLLGPGGIVVFDDYRQAHTPGTAAAVWETVVAYDLIPFLLTPGKMYATWDPTIATQAQDAAATGGLRDMIVQREQMAGREVVFAWLPPADAPQQVNRTAELANRLRRRAEEGGARLRACLRRA